MAVERKESDRVQETQVADALPAIDDEAQSILRMHERIAAKLLRDGAPSRAFSELVRATREAPLGRRLAASLVRVAVRAGAEPAAITLLNAGIEETDGSERIAIRRQLVRLLRKMGEHARAAEHLSAILSERASDRRARSVLGALLEHEQRWEDLDASLEKEVKDALARRSLRHAARVALHRARLCAERLKDPARAALRYAQAAQYRQELGDVDGALNLSMLWLRALAAAHTPKRAFLEASNAFLKLAQKAGKEERARALVAELQDPAEVTPVHAPTPPGRRITHQTLVVAADEAEARGQKAEAAALLTAAMSEGADEPTQQRLEALFVARGAWQELAHFYRDAAARAEREEKVEYLSKLAELLEDELNDTKGAAQAYGEIVELTGDRRALDEQVRLLSAHEDLSGVRRALDEAVVKAKDATARAHALVARAEGAFARRDFKTARADFDEAVRSQPANILARAGLAEAAAQLGDRAPVFAFREALGRIPRRRPGRAELYRRLARLGESPLKDALVARAAWNEVRVELPEDEEANVRLTALAREANDLAELEPLLRAQVRRESRGARTRHARLELVSVLEQKGRAADALAELKLAVKFEPGHKEAWFALAERSISRGQATEAAWALEQAATTTADEVERQQTWQRLADYVRTALKDEVRAKKYAARAEKLKRDIQAMAAERATRAEQQQQTLDRAAPTLMEMEAVSVEPPPKRAPEPRPKRVDLPWPAGADRTGETTPRAEDGIAKTPTGPPPSMATSPGQTVEMPKVELPGALSPPAPADAAEVEQPEDDAEADQSLAETAAIEGWEEPEEARAPAEDVMEMTTGDILIPVDADLDDERPASMEWEAPPGVADDEEEHRSEVAAVDAELSKSRPFARPELFRHVRDNPLDPGGYRDLSDHFDHMGDATRSVLMAEIGDALDGDPDAAPLPPKLMLSATDRAGLRHPLLRTEAGELLSLAGLGLCRLFPAKGRDAGAKEDFRLDSGRGAQLSADALLAAVRILGVRSPDVHLSEDNGPPFALIYVNNPRVLVGRLAVRKELPEAELRFFAGRALFTQSPDLLALRTLTREQLHRALSVLGGVLRGGDRGLKAEGRALRDSLSPKALPRVAELYERVGRSLPLARLMDGARHSANRAGLVVCGAVGPALSALRAKKSLHSEIAELVRFAASERYLQIRSRRLG